MLMDHVDIALPPHMDPARFVEGTLSDVQAKYGRAFAT